MMTKQDFELLARTLKQIKPDKEGFTFDVEGKQLAQNLNDYKNRLDQWKADVKAIAQMAFNQNTRFKFDVFYKACGLEQE